MVLSGFPTFHAFLMVVSMEQICFYVKIREGTVLIFSPNPISAVAVEISSRRKPSAVRGASE